MKVTDDIENKNVQYENKFVFFFDILGFENLIESKKCSYIYNIIKKCIDQVDQANGSDILLVEGDIVFENGDLKWGKIIGKPKITFFSDNAILSISEQEIDNEVYRIAQFVGNLQSYLILEGILIRGGLSYGEIYHDNDIVFGPALVKAYDIESKKIINPFIGVDSDIVEKGKEANKYTSQLYNQIFEWDQTKKVYYIDFLNISGNTAYDDKQWYLEMETVLQNKIKEEPDKIAKSKIKTLLKYITEKTTIKTTSYKTSYK